MTDRDQEDEARRLEVEEQLQGLERQDWLDTLHGITKAFVCLGALLCLVWSVPRLARLVVEWLS